MTEQDLSLTAVEARQDLAPPTPYERQILVNVGNRYVVFGSQIRIHGQALLGPGDVRARFADRVGDETEFPPERLIGSIQVKDADVLDAPAAGVPWADLQITFANGAALTVDVKVGVRDFKTDELERHWAELRELSRKPGPQHEVWNFNVERLKLTILGWEGSIPQLADLDPLYVWEFNDDGSAFDRTYLDERLDDWQRRVEAIYAEAEAWAARDGLTADRSRTILMSEELMQKFAVPDRELPILDINRGETPVMSIVPAGLWVIGSNGRIDVITQEKGAILFDASPAMQPARWVYLVRGERREPQPWNEAAFHGLIGAAVPA